MGQADPPYVKVKKSYFDWKEAKPVKSLDDTGEIASFYDDGYNRMIFFDPAGPDAEVEETGVWVPKIPLIPAEVALIIATTHITPWELHQHICDNEGGRDPAVKSMLTPVKVWALLASRKTTNKEGSIMSYTFPHVTMVSSALQKQLKKRLNVTLGTRLVQLPIPICNQPKGFNAMSPQQVAIAAVASMIAAQPTAASISKIFQQGVTTTMRMYMEL